MIAEMHVTVPLARQKDLERYVAERRPDVRIFLMVNHVRSGAPILDLFTGERVAADSSWELLADRETFRFRDAGLDPIRVKVEVEPWRRDRVTGDEYYESHLSLLGLEDGRPAPGVRGLLISTDTRRRRRYGTVRSRTCTLDQHVNRVHRVGRGLLAAHVHVLSVDHEYVAVDTCPDHDATWERG